MTDQLSVDVLSLLPYAQWEVSDFSGVKRRINRAELQFEAEARGIPMDQFFLEKLRLAELFLVQQSIDQYREANPTE